MKNLNILFFYCHGGGGHVANLRTFKRAITAKGLDWTIDAHNVYDVIESNWIEDVYNLCLRKGWTWHWGHILIPFFRLIFGFIQWNSQRKLAAFFKKLPYQPDAVVTNIQVTGSQIAPALEKQGWNVPFFVFMIDHGEVDDPDFRWGFDSRHCSYPTYFLCTTESARASMLADGHPEERVLAQRGVSIDSSFLNPPQLSDRSQGRRSRGLADIPTALISFGGSGNRMIPALIHSLAVANPEIQFVVLCGRDKATLAQLEHSTFRNRILAVGYVENVADYLALADVFIGKPGPGSLSEAVSMGVPVITVNDRNVMNQEKKSIAWVTTFGLGVVVNSLREIPAAVATILDPANLTMYRSNCLKIKNYAMDDCVAHVARVCGATDSGLTKENQDPAA